MHGGSKRRRFWKVMGQESFMRAMSSCLGKGVRKGSNVGEGEENCAGCAELLVGGACWHVVDCG